MFAHTLNPSHDGRWTRLAPIAAAATVAFAFLISLMVFLSALKTGHLLYTRQVDPAQKAGPCVVVQAPRAPCGVGG